MITMALINGVWHVITLMDGVRLCWLKKENWDEGGYWDDPFDATDWREVDHIPEDSCMKCIAYALEMKMEERMS